MKKTITTLVLAALALIGASGFVNKAKYSAGIAGYTGAPGEVTCNACHGNASSTTSGITITSVPSFTNDEFIPGTTYQITVNVAASNAALIRFGFDCEIIDDMGIDAGTMQNAGAGVKFLFAGSRNNAVHSTPKVKSSGSANFMFDWVAPTIGDTATIFVSANAVNNNGSTSGDFPIPPVFKQLKVQQSDPTVGIHKNSASALAYLSVYPNPAAGGLTQISYQLLQQQQVLVQLIDLHGKTIKELANEKQEPGQHSQVLDLQGVASGIYFVKLSGNNVKLSQKLITVQ
jgi:hypothetical protein